MPVSQSESVKYVAVIIVAFVVAYTLIAHDVPNWPVGPHASSNIIQAEM